MTVAGQALQFEVKLNEMDTNIHRCGGMVKIETVVATLEYVRGMATRAVVSLTTGLNHRESVEELDNFLEMLDRYPDVLPHKS